MFAFFPLFQPLLGCKIGIGVQVSEVVIMFSS